VTVTAGEAEVARARMLELFPGGFEESAEGTSVELTAYTDGAGEESLYTVFGSGRAEDVADDWPDRWRDFHRPVRIGPLWVGPPWAPPPADATAVSIDPGRAFGTGAHPTTRLCLELLLDLPRGSVLDVGCGSGVLGIAAARLGFGPIVAVDADAAAVEVTIGNAAANGVELEARQADARTDELPDADVALLNVSAEIVAEVVPRLDVAHVVASGYLASDRPDTPGFRSARRLETAGWAADLLRRERGAGLA
jgi:ribosomal protein L11 methyltransferase